MSGYLRKYVGKYRVIANYNEDTMDFPRDVDGKIDSSFDDLYIPCKNKIQIRHGVGNVLSCYIPSKQRAMDILRTIYKDMTDKEPPKETSQTTRYLDNLCEALVNENVLVSAEILDSEGYFEFKAANIEYIANLVGAKTKGADTSPFSTKNLPKAPYKIPEKDLVKYKEVTNLLPKTTIGDREIPNGMIIQNISNMFLDNVVSTTINNPRADRKEKCLNTKEYIHSIGLWNKYIDYMKAEAAKC